mmetsp:Transcript_90962/g.195031  ORF Transcript_90962/g.195031 Transcript_90962/m.195031 type:complete len:275 (-) Transcript_90962:200-1024(-)
MPGCARAETHCDPSACAASLRLRRLRLRRLRLLCLRLLRLLRLLLTRLLLLPLLLLPLLLPLLLHVLWLGRQQGLPLGLRRRLRNRRRWRKLCLVVRPPRKRWCRHLEAGPISAAALGGSNNLGALLVGAPEQVDLPLDDGRELVHDIVAALRPPHHLLDADGVLVIQVHLVIDLVGHLLQENRSQPSRLWRRHRVHERFQILLKLAPANRVALIAVQSAEDGLHAFCLCALEEDGEATRPLAHTQASVPVEVHGIKDVIKLVLILERMRDSLG